MIFNNYKTRLIYLCIYAASSFVCFSAATKFTDCLCIWAFKALGSSFAVLFWLVLGYNTLHRNVPTLATLLDTFSLGIVMSYRYAALGIGIVGLFSVTILQLGVAVFSLFQAENLCFGFKFGGILLAFAVILLILGIPGPDKLDATDKDLEAIVNCSTIIMTILWFFGLVAFAAAACYNVLIY